MENNNPQSDKISFIEKYGINPLLFGALSLLVIFVSYQVIGSLIVFFIIGTDIKSLDPNQIRIISSLGQIIFLLLPTLFLAKLMPEKFRTTFKLNRISFKLIILIIVSVFAIMEIAQILLVLQSQIPLPDNIREILSEFKKTMEETYKILVNAEGYPELGFVIFVIAVVPAVCEELLFRGLLQYNFTKGMGAKYGILFTGIIFAMFHFNPFAFIALMVLGIYFSFLVYKTDSIYSSIIGHFTNNFIASISLFYFGKDDVLLNSSDEILTSSQLPSLFIIFIISLGIFIVSLYLIFRETARENSTK